MKKFRRKIFGVLFIILTIFLMSFLFIFNILEYNREYEDLEKNLIKMSSERGIPVNSRNEIKNPESKKIFMDYIVYVVSIDSFGNIVTVTNHSQDDAIGEQEIKEEAIRIINTSVKEEVVVKNLFFSKYSYAIKSDKIVIIDNTKIRLKLMENMKVSFYSFAAFELLAVYGAYILTKWLSEPIEESFKKQKQFIADASHELKTPIAVIMASAEALENDRDENKWLDNIKSETDRMNTLVTELLEMAKTEKNDVQYQKENLSKIVAKSILTFESLVYEKNIKFEHYVMEEIYWKCNALQIKQVLGILIDNAIKHSEKDGEIFVSLIQNKNEIELEVKNKGEEIPKEERDKIFERFYRADNSRNREENRYGLGLAIAKNIIENHEGTITVDCKDGYTSFKIKI